MKHTLLFTAFIFLFFQCALAQNYILDNTFGSGGKVITSFGSADSNMASMSLQADGKILTCGSYYDGLVNQIALSRYNIDGSLDNSFGTNGKVLTPIGTNLENEHNTVRVLNNGKILVSGTNGTSSSYDFAIVQYNSNGSLDLTFGNNGVVLSDFNNEHNISTLEIQTDNKIVIGGSILIPSSNNNSNFAIARYNIDGSKDTSFGINGLVSINIGTVSNNLTVSDDYVDALKIQSDGKIIASGLTSLNNGGDFGMVRLNTDGSIDSSFGINGRVITDFGSIEEANAIQILSDGKIILSGIYYYNSDTNEKVVIAKYNSNGTLDATYGTSGKVITDFGNSSPVDFAFSSQIQTDGKLLIIGYVKNATADAFIAIYNIDGTLDTSLNSSGFLFIDFGVNEDAVTSVFQTDGKLLLGGATYNGSIANFMLLRLEIDNLSTKSFENNKFYISPNPFTDSITISTKDINLSLATIELYDISGRKISNFTTENTNNFTFSINSNLSKGNYFLKITDQQTTQTFKLIKE